MDYQLHDFPTVSKEDEEAHVLLNTGLVVRIEALESQNRELIENCCKLQMLHHLSLFHSTNFAGNDDLIRVYTGFPSYEAFLSFLSFWNLLCMS